MSVKRFVAPLAGGMLAAAAAFGFSAVGPMAPAANAAPTWASIAVAPGEQGQQSGYGVVWNHYTQSEAEGAAISECASYPGNDNCEIAITVSTGCAAVADSDDSWAAGTGYTREEAEGNALYNNDGGIVLAWTCTGA